MTFKDAWCEQLYKKIKLVYPHEPDSVIRKFASDVYDRDKKDANCLLYNNYEKSEINTSVEKVLDWCNNNNAILSESGTIFKQHDEVFNPDIEILQETMNDRAEAKKKMFKYKDMVNKDTDPEEKEKHKYLANKANLAQKRYKVISNSEYGASGLKSSWFFNIAVSSATTSRGQALISTSCCAFEDFLADNIKFMNMDECLIFINNIVSERAIRSKSDKKWIKNKNDDEVVERLRSKFYETDICDTKLIQKIVSGLSQEDKNRIYYKSNLYNFILESNKAQYLIKHIALSDVEFKDCGKCPDELKNDVEKLTSAVLEYVHYNYPTINRTLRLKTQKRKVVITVDTDSCFLNLGVYLDFIVDLLIKSCSKITKRTDVKEGIVKIAPMANKDFELDSDTRYRIANTMMYCVNAMISRTLDTFLSRCNCSRKHGTTKMKNEFMYDRILLCAPAKKHYQGAIRLQEGLEFPEPIFDVKGMDYMKPSAAGEKTRKFIQKFVYEDILTAKKINMSKILKKLRAFEKEIEESVLSGKDDYIKTANIKSEDAYADPLSIGPFKAAYVWNYLNPDNKIELPGIAKILKLKISKLKDIAQMSVDYPDIYARFKKMFTENDRIAKSGITSIAIPLDEAPPDWILPYINLEEIISNNTDLLLPILNSLGIKVIYRNKSSQFFSNIIDI